MELKECRKELLEAIKKFMKNYGYSPSVRELCFLTDKSPATIHHHLKKLKEEEYIDFVEGKNRTITLTGKQC